MAIRKKNASGGNSLLTLGLLAVGGYFVYEWFFAPSAAASTTTTTTTTPASTTTTPAASTTSTSTTATSTSGTTLDAIYAAILSGAASDPNFTGSGSSLTGSAYHFNVYLAIAAPGMTIPDPASVFGNATAADQPMTAAAYWAKMGPAMSAANAGLSGGIGAFAGIGAFMTGLGAYAWR
jgi:hypothetical protein